MKAIIFGINGQDGYYLNQLLQSLQIEVIGVSRLNPSWQLGNVADNNFTAPLIKLHQPDFVFHLAANSTTNHDALFENHETIATGTLNILEACYKFCPKAKVFITGSGLQFINIGKPIKETDDFEAKNPYCISRIQSVYAARYYRMLGLKVYVGYLFHHDSPLRTARHVNQKIVLACKRIAAGYTEKIELGNIEVIKEFGYALDIVHGIWTLINQDAVFEATIGTGSAYSIKDWLSICFHQIGKEWQDWVVINRNFKSEYQQLVSNPETINIIGWQSKVNITRLANIMLKQKVNLD